MRLSLVSRVVIATATIVGVLSAAAPALAGRAAAGPYGYAAPNHRVDHSTSTNWSGYAVSGFGPYRSVSSSWRQPAVDCSKTPTGWSNPVSAGDSLSASVTYAGNGYFRLTLSDETRGWSHTTTQRLKSAKLGSAEVIAEAPSGSGGILPLADFGTAAFSAATVNGLTLTSSTPGLDPITKVSGSTLSAVPSAISGGSFADNWYSQ